MSAPSTSSVHALRALDLAGTYSTGEDALRKFYLPALAASYAYDRMAGYYSSSVLRITAAGLAGFLQNARANGGRMRLIVGTQLNAADIEAVRDGVLHRDAAIAEAARRSPLDLDGDVLGDEYLRLLGWMVRESLLEVKVGIPVDADGKPLAPDEAKGYFHSKYGILTDTSGDRVAFIGSENETATGWLYNHETFSVAKSWREQVWEDQGAEIVERFEAHWNNHPDHGWAVLPLQEVDDRLLKLAPADYVPPEHDPIWQVLGIPQPGDDESTSQDTPSDAATVAAWQDLLDIAATPTTVPFTATLTAPATPLPHQARLVHRAVTSFPRGYLFADPVGFGKTVELGLTLRELLLSGQAEKALILVPASVLKQWQEELSEKIGLDVARYDGGKFYDVAGNELAQPANSNPWSAFPIVLASSHLARRRARRQELQAAGPWDVVIVDEAHHARRRGSKATDTPNSLLALLQDMKRAGLWTALYLASATPMQMHPHEAWDLIQLLDLPGKWGKSASDFLSYYEQLREVPEARSWPVLQAMLSDYRSDKEASVDKGLEQAIRTHLGPARARKITSLDSMGMSLESAAHLTVEERFYLDAWLRRHTPMKDRVFRNTRDTLRAYQAAGVIPEDVTIPERHVADEFIVLDNWERHLYERIEQYIRRYYNAYMAQGETKALGFIMTVYRRRLTSSFYAIRQSLKRRLAALEAGLTLGDLLADDDRAALEEDMLFDVDDEAVRLDLLRGEINELRDFVRDLEAITGQDTKATRLIEDLNQALQTYASVVVFTQYTDTMDYVRGRLVAAGYEQVGCYSGRGGELWNGSSWLTVSKEEIKQKFRDGDLHVLIGTDSMSEGLNLQTSGRLFNYDMPWNLMRAEQRIGRVDRIGAAYKDIHVSNYFYAGTVEETVYKGIAQDFGDFTEIVGSAQPVLGSIEQAIEDLALRDDGNGGSQMAKAQAAVEHLKQEIADVNSQAILLQDLGDRPEEHLDVGGEALSVPTEVQDHGQLLELGERLLENALARRLFTPVEGTPTFELRLPEQPSALSFTSEGRQAAHELLVIPGLEFGRVTFDRAYAERHPDVKLLTFGSSVLATLLPIPRLEVAE